ncbi:MAG: phosphoribosylamine--glycine ligase [Alphaproteobacteria bacterium]|nr:phosphoribosylamine--glycine ligase [Alphaproteobacteria bacterium]
MRVLVVGGGGREHALCWAIAASPLCDKLYCAPGNAGIAQEAECVPIVATDLDGLVAFARSNRIDFVVVGPEAPLVAGLVDRLESSGIKAFGPSAAAARLEGSKAFMKDLCRQHGIPTAAYATFTDPLAAKAHVRSKASGCVVKADGLAAGKGVVVAATVAAAVAAIDGLTHELGAAATTLVIEELLVGEEASFHALVDGTTVLPLATAQDYKRVGDGDRGPNTGGMGAYSPAPVVSDAMAAEVVKRILKPTVTAMATAGTPFRGVLYAGLMITHEGPKLLEYNVRFGDPECQVLIPRMMSDLLPALVATRDGELAKFHLRWWDKAAVCVVMATTGYPGAYPKGSVIRGLDAAGSLPDVTVFHAGTARVDDDIVAQGGRVLGVTALGTTIRGAQAQAYSAIDRIDWPEGFCRRDIGRRASA